MEKVRGTRVVGHGKSRIGVVGGDLEKRWFRFFLMWGKTSIMGNKQFVSGNS